MIGITLVRVGDKLIGKTVSDRWNMEMLGMGDSIPATRNQTTVKRLRRQWADAFTFTVARKMTVELFANDDEVLALGTNLAEIAA